MSLLDPESYVCARCGLDSGFMGHFGGSWYCEKVEGFGESQAERVKTYDEQQAIRDAAPPQTLPYVLHVRPGRASVDEIRRLFEAISAVSVAQGGPPLQFTDNGDFTVTVSWYCETSPGFGESQRERATSYDEQQAVRAAAPPIGPPFANQDNGLRRCEFVSVHDGDTFVARIVAFEAPADRTYVERHIRVHGWNAAELRDAEGPRMRDAFGKMLQTANVITVRVRGRSFERIVCSVFLDGVLFAGLLEQALGAIRAQNRG